MRQDLDTIAVELDTLRPSVQCARIVLSGEQLVIRVAKKVEKKMERWQDLFGVAREKSSLQLN